MASTIPQVTLNSGAKMPMIAFGTASVDNISEEQMVAVILDAIEAGYRHFDTAAAYGTERPLGLAIAEAIRLGLVRGRDDVFITSKLWCTDADPEFVIPAIRASLGNLGLDYLDLYLIHWPVRVKHDRPSLEFIDKNDLLPFDIASTWAAMEECQRLGLTKSIGVSNFATMKLTQLLLHAKIPPVVNQVEMSPQWDQRKLRSFCHEKGVHIVAWSPLGGGPAFWGSDGIINNTLLMEVAKSKGKTIAQVVLRWVHEQGVSIAVKSYNGERMRENLKIFDWRLSEEEKKKIEEIPQKRGFMGVDFTSPNGPYKTVEELWDGEV